MWCSTWNNERGGERWWVLGEQGDGGLEGREVPVISYAPVVESVEWWERWGIAGFLGGGFVLGVVGFGVEGIGGAAVRWVGVGVVLMVVVIGWVVQKRPYWKAVALAIGFGLGSDVLGGVLRKAEAGVWLSVADGELWHFVVVMSLACILGSMFLGLLSLLSLGLWERLWKRGRREG